MNFGEIFFLHPSRPLRSPSCQPKMSTAREFTFMGKTKNSPCQWPRVFSRFFRPFVKLGSESDTSRLSSTLHLQPKDMRSNAHLQWDRHSFVSHASLQMPTATHRSKNVTHLIPYIWKAVDASAPICQPVFSVQLTNIPVWKVQNQYLQ